MEETVKVSNVDTATIKENKKSLFPTLMVELPSKGLVYPLDNPLSSGVVEIKYMTTKEEDILTTESYIKTGVVLDKLLQSLIVNPSVIKSYDNLIIGDKNALLIAARMYGVGETYDTEVTTPSGNAQKLTINLAELKHTELQDWEIFRNENRFTYKLPSTGNVIEFKLMTLGDDKEVTQKLKKFKTIDGRDLQLSERLIKMILSVDGDTDPIKLKLFVDNMRATDSRAFRNYVASIQPNIDMSIETVDEDTGEPFRGNITIGPSFFWPEL